MNTTIYYFTATGNSLKIARDLQGKIAQSTLVPIARVMKEDHLACHTEKAGIVFPIYMLGLPNIIHRFFQKIDLSMVTYIFVVITSGGGNITAMQQARKALNAKSKSLNAGFYIKMGSNNIELYTLKSEKSLQKLFDKANTKVDTIAHMVRSNQKKIEHGIMLMNWIIGSKVNRAWLKRVHENDKKHFVEEQCNSCEICVKVCPVDNITLEHGTPTWHHHCEECRACIHHCPQMAIQINAKTKKQGRYIHPEIRVRDIINQKSS